jgi:hypothetical protein
MSKNSLVMFWVFWLLDVLLILFAYREFIMLTFGQYAAPNFKLVALWVVLLLAAFGIIAGSIYLKNHEQTRLAIGLAAVPLVLMLPYVLFLLVMVIGGSNTRWN